MHPYYGPNAKLLQEKEGTKSWYLGLVSMGMYLVFWAGVFLVTVRLFKKYLMEPEDEEQGTDEALDILRVRYAKGEITAREYKKMKCRLM